MDVTLLGWGRVCGAPLWLEEGGPAAAAAAQHHEEVTKRSDARARHLGIVCSGSRRWWGLRRSNLLHGLVDYDNQYYGASSGHRTKGSE